MEERKTVERRRGLLHIAADIHEIRYRLKRVETDAGRECYREKRRVRMKADAVEQCSSAADEEIVVFVKAEDPEIRQHPEPEEPRAARRILRQSRKRPRKVVRRDCGKNEQPEEPPIPCSVKDVARDEEQPVLSAVRESVVNRKHAYKKGEESERIEKHRRLNDGDLRGLRRPTGKVAAIDRRVC